MSTPVKTLAKLGQNINDGTVSASLSCCTGRMVAKDMQESQLIL